MRCKPLFEDFLGVTKPSSLLQAEKRPPPSQRFVTVAGASTYQGDMFGTYSRASSWPASSVLQDWRVSSGGLFFQRYGDTHDIQEQTPWLVFNDTYEAFFNMYSLYSGGGSFAQRVVIHAHHFPNKSGHVAAPPFMFGEGMPPIHKELMATHFLRAVECTGMNLSLLAVRKWQLCMFEATASCLYALRPHGELSFKRNNPCSLLRSCIIWLLEDRNVLKRMNVTVNGNNQHLNINDTILNQLCKGLVACDPTGATLSLGQSSTEGQRLMMYKRYIDKLVEADESTLHLFAERFFPKLNSLFIQVLCELYCEISITVIDFVLRAVRTYTHSSNETNNSTIQNLFLYKVAMPNEYYYGLINNEQALVGFSRISE
jgi:hypothetical protein